MTTVPRADALTVWKDDGKHRVSGSLDHSWASDLRGFFTQI